MVTSVQSSRRPVTVSSMSSLDSLIDAALDTTTTFPDEHGQMPVESNVVSSSTLSSIGASPTHISSAISEKEAPLVTNETVAAAPSAPTGMVLSAPVPAIQPSSAAAIPIPIQAPVAPNNNTVAEFLFQLSKMLTDDNTEIIEWSNGQINVHDPYRLQSEVLHNYFRHSKFASFQRQLNYFGFRKLAGKGKMAPCSYVNEATTPDIRSLLLIKRKPGGMGTKEKGPKKRARGDGAKSTGSSASTAPVNPVLAGILHRTSGVPAEKEAKPAPGSSKKGRGSRAEVTSSSSQQELARAAVGRGVRHGFISSSTPAGSATEALASASMIFPDPPHLGLPGLQDSLSELTNNYHNSLQQVESSGADQAGKTTGAEEAKTEADPSFQMYNFLSRDSSLVDLAMLVPTTTTGAEAPVTEPEQPVSVEPTPVNEMSGTVMPFLDFATMQPTSGEDESG